MLPAYNAGPMQPQNRPAVPGADKKVLAGVLGIVLGGLGRGVIVHEHDIVSHRLSWP